MHTHSMYYPYPLSILVEILFFVFIGFNFRIGFLVPFAFVSSAEGGSIHCHFQPHLGPCRPNNCHNCDGLKLPISYTPWVPPNSLTAVCL